MRFLITIFSLVIILNASILDFTYLNKAKEAYNKKDYKTASKYYSKVSNDEAKFDQANSLYKAKDYKNAIKLYDQIQDKNLQFKKLHNLGNSYAHIGKIDQAIQSYKSALKIKEDKDTKYNLKLLEQQKKKNQKNTNPSCKR